MNNIKLNSIVKVIANTSNHRYIIGQTYKVIRINNNQYYLTSIDNNNNNNNNNTYAFKNDLLLIFTKSLLEQDIINIKNKINFLKEYLIFLNKNKNIENIDDNTIKSIMILKHGKTIKDIKNIIETEIII